MASDLRAAGDEHYEAKEYKKAVEYYTKAIEAETDLGDTAFSLSSRSAAYIHLGNLDKALEDAKLCIERKPDWSTSHARAAEAYSRLQNMTAAESAYSAAVRLAEDDETRLRLTVAADTIKRELKQRKKQQQLKEFIYAPYDTTWVYRLYLKETGHPMFSLENRAGLDYMSRAWKLSNIGLEILDEFIFKVPESYSPRLEGVPLSNVLDIVSPHFYPLSVGGAVQDIKFAYDLLEEGNRIWQNQIPTECPTFDAAFVRVVKRKLMQYSLDAALNAKNKAAKKKHSLGMVETLAMELIEEKAEALWPPVRPSTSPAYAPLDYYSMPTVHAFVALATVSAQRGLKAVESDVSSGGIALANSEHTQKAADYYVIALGLVPEDYYLTPMYCWKRLELYLRLGGVKTASEILAWSDQAEEIQRSLEPFFDELAEEDDSRTFVRDQVQKIRDWLVSPDAKTSTDGVGPIFQIVKAVPTLNLRATSPTFDSSSVLTEKFWMSLEGDIRIVHVLPRE